jgi:hypothetical protein
MDDTLKNTPEPDLGPASDVEANAEGSRGWFAAMAEGRHPSTVQLVRYFAYAHLADSLRPVAKMYAPVVEGLLDELDDCAELTVSLRALLGSKDSAVRALVDQLAG